MTRDLFKKIRDLQGHFVPRNGTLIDQKGKQLSHGEEIKSRWKEYSEELYKKDTNDAENLKILEYEPEPGILESNV